MGSGKRSRSLVEWFIYGAVILLLTASLYSFYNGNSSAGSPIHLRNGFLGYSSANNTTNCTWIQRDADNDQLHELRLLLEKTATPNKTVILTSLNEAWAAPGSIFDLFLESLRTGNNTQRYLNHLLVVSFDDGAHTRCLAVHARGHCYRLRLEEERFNLTDQANFMSSNYLEIVWRKIEFLGDVLSLGYNFIFTDCDILWLRDPFPHLLQSNANFQVACDYYNGNPQSMNNRPNTGFMYVRSDKHTIMFYKLWYLSRYTYPNMHDQDGFNAIRSTNLFHIIGLNVRFLETTRFSGFCQLSTDFHKVCTVHANCCVGLGQKVHDLNLVLGDWRNYKSMGRGMVQSGVSTPAGKWSVPNRCRVRR